MTAQPQRRDVTSRSVRLGMAAGLAVATLAVTTLAVTRPAHAASDNPDQGGAAQSAPQPNQPPPPAGAASQGPMSQGSGPSANAAISDGTIGKAAAALRDVAKLQQDYSGKINAAGSNDEKRGLSEKANAEAVQAIQSHGLSVQEYASVVQTARADPQVRQRLLSAANMHQ